MVLRRAMKVSDRSINPLYRTSSTRASHTVPHTGESSKICFYFPVLCPEHAGLAVEILRLSALSIADAFAIVTCCRVLLPAVVLLMLCCAVYPAAVLMETAVPALLYVWALQHAAADAMCLEY